MTIRVVNIDILDDVQPKVLVQRYFTPKRSYQVFRIPTQPEEYFLLTDGVKVDPNLYWAYSAALGETPDPEENLLPVFAVIYLDEENPPSYNVDDLPEVEAYANITYDADAGLYRAEATDEANDRLDLIAAPAIDEVILRTVEELDRILNRRPAPDAITDASA